MDTRPDHVGNITDDVCFDVECHKEKAATFKKENEQEQSATTTTAGGSPAKAKKPAKKKTASATPKKVDRHVDGFIVDTAKKVVEKNSKWAYVVALDSMWKGIPSLDKAKYIEAEPKVAACLKNKDRHSVFGALFELSDAELTQGVERMAQFMLRDGEHESEWIKTAQQVIKSSGLALEEHFVLDKEFLSAHTKVGIESILREAGFDQWWNEQKGDGAFKKLIAMKVTDLIDAVCLSKFDFCGFVPSVVSKRIV